MIKQKTLAAFSPAAMPSGAPTREYLEQVSLGMAEGYVVQVTPAMAEAWMRQNTIGDQHNRRFRARHAHTLAAEMRKGQWSLTHQGIAFGTSGRLLDGQHRLQAIIESGVPAPLVVFIDAPEDAFPNYDRGARRDMSDVLGEHNGVVATAQTIVRQCLYGTSATWSRQRTGSPPEVARVLEAFADDIKALHDVTTETRPGRSIASLRAAWVVQHHTADEAGKQLLKEQWKALISFDVRSMDASTAAGDTRLGSRTATTANGSWANLALCIGWLMFDPARRDLDRILIRNPETALSRFRAAARSVVPDLQPDPTEASVEKTEGRAAPKSVKKDPPNVWRPMSDPVLGPQLREKAVAAIAAKRAAAEAARG